jgi:hypothetical protein
VSVQKLFPQYIRRGEPEQKIRQAVLEVQRQRQSRALLLYGVGGIGKSYLLRHLRETLDIENVLILGPYDADDLEFWSLTNLQKRISEAISGNFFDDYKDYIFRLPQFERPTVGHETALAYLRKGDEVFERCYRRFVEEGGSTPIIVLDTIEAIRGADTMKKILVWIKRLPATLFILSGRPPEGELKEFTREESLAYFQKSGVAAGLTDEERDRLVLLCQGHPLWLSLAVYYTATLGLPEEIKKLTFNVADQPWPYQNGPLHDAFIRRLVVPYREPGFWHEAVLRLGVVRQRLNKELWKALMQDQPLPEEAGGWDQAWEQFQQLPWVRPRANRHYVTLQDALAEELAKRILPHQDYNRSWRQGLWQKSIQNYTAVIDRQEYELQDQRQRLDEALKKAQPGEQRSDLMSNVLEVENRSMELFLVHTARLYYQMLVDYQAGSRQFTELFDRAAAEHQYRFIELLWSEMQCFLPGEQTSYAAEKAIEAEVQNFQ